MSSDIEKLESFQKDVRNFRAILPQVVRKLAFVNDNEDSLQLFKDMSQRSQDWLENSIELDKKYESIKPLLDEFNQAGSK